MRSRRDAIASVGLVVALATGFAWHAGWGQDSAATPTQGQADSSPSTLQVYSRETLVDVTVTDLKGQAVRGLTQADFTVEEDGKPQAIRGFHEYSKGDSIPAQAPPKLPPNVYTNIQPPPAGSAVNILLLDALNTLPADQVYVKEESMKYLKSMPRGTQVAVLGLTSRLRILQGVTSDPAVLVAAINSKKNRALPSPFMDADTGTALDSISEVVDDGAAATLQEFSNEQATFQTDMRNRMTLEALNQIAAYLAGIKGRKNLIWFTSGIPLNVFPTGGVNDLQGITDYAKDLRKTTDLLTAAQVAVYPVDARGLFNNPANSAANHVNISAKNGAQASATNTATSTLAFNQKTATEQLSMTAVAEATGGEAYFNTNDLKSAVGKAIEDGANYYTLSYVPPDPNYDGRYHSINVKVNRPDVHLSYRKGYNADDIQNNAITPSLTLASSAPEPYGTNMQASMARSVPTSSQLLFSVRMDVSDAAPKPNDPPIMGMLDPKLKDKPLVRYAFQYSLPARQVSFREQPDKSRKGSVQFDVAVYDVYGKMITSLGQTISLPITAAQYQQLQQSTTPIRFFQQLDLPPGEMFVRVGVLDETSDKVGTLEIPLTVKKKTTASAGANGAKSAN